MSHLLHGSQGIVAQSAPAADAPPHQHLPPALGPRATCCTPGWTVQALGPKQQAPGEAEEARVHLAQARMQPEQVVVEAGLL